MRDAKNIQALCQLPINYIGFIFYAQSPRYIVEKPAVTIPSNIKKTGVFVDATADEIFSKIQDFGLDVIQLHGNETPEFCTEIQKLKVTTFKAFGINDSFDWDSISAYQDAVDYFLFDTKSHAYGGTGQSFNWDILRQNPYDKPYFLSGGLSLKNIKEAATFDDERLYSLDLNSKFEIEPALKNIELLTQALLEIK